MEPEREYSYSFRLTRSGKPTKLSSCFTPGRNQHISDQESPFFQIPGSIQEGETITGKEKAFFQPEEEIVRPYDPETAGTGERSTKNN
ncbi:hypothetical protein O181_007399 [Austropuccinia psidii MF-1]|uniref:Uncharacterized protein n=1 Tax=Austropuccinia psidii MF-1 TaxID=1389203 RepID=A0A9Q3BKU0_9BASI|nr:hypothetical protein [Austropuccinia psidii MF-1]